MAVLKNPYMKHILKIPFFIKILVFVLLSWIYQYNKCTIVKYLEYGSRIDTFFGRNTNRLLAKHRDESELQRIRLQNKTNDYVNKYKLANGNESNNIYGHLKQDKLNNVDTYLKNYKSRYAKKKGLKKLDCYYEKMLFSSINKLEKLIEKNNLSTNRIKRVTYTKYGLPFILLSLLPILSLAVPFREITRVIKVKAPNGITVKGQDSTEYAGLLKKITTYDSSIHCTILCITITIILSLIIYTHVKIMKYKIIKAGMLK